MALLWVWNTSPVERVASLMTMPANAYISIPAYASAALQRQPDKGLDRSLGGRHHLVHQPLCQATGLAHVVDIAKVVQ